MVDIKQDAFESWGSKERLRALFDPYFLRDDWAERAAEYYCAPFESNSRQCLKLPRLMAWAGIALRRWRVNAEKQILSAASTYAKVRRENGTL